MANRTFIGVPFDQKIREKQMNIFTLHPNKNIASKTVHIHAPASKVWEALTTPALMNQWMMPDSKMAIITNWQVGSLFIIRGNLHGINFENKGTILQFESKKVLEYNHLSSISRLPNQPKSYSNIEFRLTPGEDQTSLTVTLSNFPTESIYKHLIFYWNVTLEILKKMIEEE